ncbi:hypothetical protein FDG2_5596 [Candidatus Protofrankia californiensis]|uniref:Uncharacterized protein n=1 Tax=Candidatus Protofrankia californiensis TaxID=1839754 RepID=A0A1C3PEK8_9ACTN|nr:hypothetical protein FDG2_5596 [Candidatus Protofrankia californiensis]
MATHRLPFDRIQRGFEMMRGKEDWSVPTFVDTPHYAARTPPVKLRLELDRREIADGGMNPPPVVVDLDILEDTCPES